MIQFKLDFDADPTGTSFHNDVFSVPPCDLYEAFGDGMSDGYKTAMEYVFTDEDDNKYTLYDWKETSLYHGEDNGYPSAREFTQSAYAYSFHIGHKGMSKARINAFKAWLKEQIYAPSRDVEAQLVKAHELESCSVCQYGIKEGDHIVLVATATYKEVDDDWRDPGYMEFTTRNKRCVHVQCLKIM